MRSTFRHRHRRRHRPHAEGAFPIGYEIRNEDARRHRPRRRRHGLLWALLVIVALLIVGRLMLPSVLRDFVNRRLDRHPGYSGSIGPIDVQLWRGAYSIRDVVIHKTGMDMEAPLFRASRLDLAMEWDELFHGALVGEITMVRPEVNFIAGPTPEQTQTGEDQQWDETLKDLFPFRLNRVEILNGAVRFLNPHATPKVDVSIHNLAAVATNLTNARDMGQTLPAGVSARGQTVGDGLVDLQVHLNPMERHPTFEMTCVLTNVNMVALNDLLEAYGKFDVERGTMHLYTSVASREGEYEGYVKVLLEEIWMSCSGRRIRRKARLEFSGKPWLGLSRLCSRISQRIDSRRRCPSPVPTGKRTSGHGPPSAPSSATPSFARYSRNSIRR